MSLKAYFRVSRLFYLMSISGAKFLFLQLVLITLLALISGYQVPDLSQSNWETVLFLTPAGMVQNYLSANPVMRSFYADISSGQNQMSLSRMGLMVVCYIGLLLNVYLFLKKETGK